MLKLSPNSIPTKLLQLLLAVGYVALVRQLLAVQASFFGEAGPGLWHVLVVLAVVSLGLAALFLVNLALLRHSWFQLGIFASVAIFIYYYIYNPQGLHPQLFVSILMSPPHLINLLLLVLSPVLMGKFIQRRSGVISHA
jgi:hypothetical protein